MFGFHQDSPARRKKKRSNLEFDFITGSPIKSVITKKTNVPATAAKPASATATPAVQNIPVRDTAPFNPQEQTTPNQKRTEPMSFSEPTPIRTARSIERQIKEQNTVNNVLNGIAVAVICGIVLVAGLAGTGGYVLWKQIQNQSASISLLEENTKDRMADLQKDLSSRQTELSKNLEQTNQRLMTLTAQFESYRTDSQQSLAELKSNNRALERSLSLYQRKSNEQETVLAQLRDRMHR